MNFDPLIDMLKRGKLKSLTGDELIKWNLGAILEGDSYLCECGRCMKRVNYFVVRCDHCSVDFDRRSAK